MLVGNNRCLQMGVKINASEGWEVLGAPCNEKSNTYFDIRVVEDEEAEAPIDPDIANKFAFGGLGEYNFSGDSALNNRSSAAILVHNKNL